jgi:hypothetical protein
VALADAADPEMVVVFQDGQRRHGAPRRVLAAGFAALVVGVGAGVGAFAFAGGGASTPGASNVSPKRVQFLPRSAAPEPIPAGTGAALAAAPAGTQIAPTDWVADVRSLAVVRPAASGTLEISIHSGSETAPVEAAQTISFAVSSSGVYDIRFPGNTAFATTDGAQVQILDDRRLVQILSDLPPQVAGKPAWVQTNGELELPNDAVSRVLYPDKWIELMAPKNDMTVLYVGAEQAVNRPTRHYRITFGASTVKYSAAGWDFWVDADTGVLVRYLIHYSDDAGGGTEEAVVGDLDTRAAVSPATTAIPSGYSIEVTVQSGGQVAAVIGQTQPGDTVSTVIARARQSADVSADAK